jgi:hypothetical protein
VNSNVQNPRCGRCNHATIALVAYTESNYGRDFYTCPACGNWNGWCDEGSFNPRLYRRQICRVEKKIDYFAKYGAIGLIIIGVLILLMLIVIYFKF